MTCKLAVFPSPNDPTAFPWNELMLGIPGFNSDNYSDIDGFWSLAVQKLSSYRSIDIQGPGDEAWFHLRRRVGGNEKENRQCAPYRIEILRIKNNFIPDELKEEIRCIAENYPIVVCAGWWGTEFKSPHDNPFLSFLQKLSVLRTINEMVHPRNLGRISHERYDLCPYCQEAYKIMQSPDEPWYIPLAPWFEYFTSANLDSNLTHEYAHWFGHILSGWEGL